MLSRGRVVERDGHGRTLRMVGTLSDLTDRREAEALRIARDRAEAAHRAKTEFLSRMSHELRTALNALLGFAQILSRRLGAPDIAEQRRCVDDIEQAGWDLPNLINDVLDLSSIEEGKMPMALQPVALAPLLRDALAAAAPQALPRAIVLRADELPEGAFVVADRERLLQVLGKLLGNAVKYNRNGGSVTLGVLAQGGAWQVAVTDTGVGIPQAQMPHLFEPFNRLGLAEQGAGVGVGLVLRRWLLRAMGGRWAGS